MEAYQHLIALKPLDPDGLLGAANVSLKTHKLDEAQQFAERAVEAGSQDPRRPVDAHVVLANIALTRRDPDAARSEAALIKQSDPATVWPLFVDARLLHDEGSDDDALPLFERTNAELKKSRGAAIPDLHYLTGEAFIQAGRYPEAEAQLREELRSFPHNLRASAALATLYQSTGQLESAARVVSDLPRITPTPDSYALAAKLWTSLGDRKQAAQVRADAKQAFSNRRTTAH
jgi:tetratricopeptide (TPR) repeat protein